jgi:hypothetical protein
VRRRAAGALLQERQADARGGREGPSGEFKRRSHLGVDLGSVVTPNRSASAVALVMSVMLRGWHVAQIASKA